MIKIGSSETIRKTTFNFYNYKNNIVSHKKAIDKHFLEWFIGFSEASCLFSYDNVVENNKCQLILNKKKILNTSKKISKCSFIVSNNRLFFIINQKDEKILHIIKSNLGFGKISTYKTYSRFIVADKTNVDKLISIFNGNLLLNETNTFFKIWLQERNGYSLNCIKYIRENTNKFSLHNNSWLTGFIDAEGVFNALKQKNIQCKIGFNVNLRFIINETSETHILKKIQCFLKYGTICLSTIQEKSLVKKFYFLMVSDRKSHEILIKYLNKYPLRTIKKVSFLRFCSILRYTQNLDNYPWTIKSLKKLERLIKNIEKLN